jgi:hypothetical protein
MTLVTAIDWAGKGLTLLVVLLAALFVTWQCLEGLMKVTTIGRGFFHYCINRRSFERWLEEMREQEQADRERRAQEARESE